MVHTAFMKTKRYTVQQLAQLAGISVRTLHYYDEIGLLRPESRSDAGYRYYGEDELLRLQQILFYRELDVPLAEIGPILDDPGFNLVDALRQHRARLKERVEHHQQLLNTIDQTLQRLEDSSMTITDKDLYAGFSPERRRTVREDAVAQYGEDAVAASEHRARGMSPEAWTAYGEETEAVNRGLAALLDREPDDPEVQALIARHYATITAFHTPTAEVYRGLGMMYAEHPEFRAHYEKVAVGMPEFLQKAMTVYADRVLAPAESSDTTDEPIREE